MNNNTKIRLHLSKNLFESIAKEVLAEAKKPNDGYSVAVKQPKMPKQSKNQATSPEVQKTDAEAKLGEIETNVAEESQLNEIDPSAVDWAAVAAGLAGIGLNAALINKLHKWWEKKHPESFKKAQGLSAHMDKVVGGNQPGEKAGQVNPGKTFGPKEGTLKEYEQHYEIRNGQCRRYNDEGDYEVVSMHYCR